MEPDTTDETPESDAVVEVEHVPEDRPVVAEFEVAVVASAVSHFAEADAPESNVEDEHEVVEHELVAVAEVDADLDFSLTDDVPTGDVPNEDLPTDEVEGTDAVDTPAEETPDTGGRFGTRKQKASKQKRSGGAKGRKIVGLKIGASQIAAAVVSETEAGHELLQLARRSLAAGIVVDGEVRDEAALASAVKAFFDEEKLPKTDVHIGLSSNRIGVRTLDIDGVEDESRFDNAVRFKAHEVLPVALSESVLDYRVLEERVGEDGQATRRVLLVVAPRDQVEPYQRVAIQAGLKLSAIDLEALGLLRAFVEPGTGVPTARRHGDRRHRDRARVVDAARLRWRRLRVHARLRLGRRRARGCDRRLAGSASGRGGHDPPSPLALRPGPRSTTRSTRRPARRRPMRCASGSPRSPASS